MSPSALTLLLLLPSAPAQVATTTAAQSSTTAVALEVPPAVQAPPIPAPAPAPKKPRPGFYLPIDREGFELRLRANVQSDVRVFVDDEGKRAIDGFLLRRVRPSLEGQLFGFARFRVMPDFGGGKVELFDAYAELEAAGWLKLRVGKSKEGFGLERLQSQTDLVFIERSQANGLVPNRDVGAMLSGSLLSGALHYSLGIWNGVADGGSSDLDLDDRKDFVGRVFVKPFKLTSLELLHEVGVGFAASHGVRRGTAKDPQLPAYRTPAQQRLFSYDGDGTAPLTAYANGDLDRFSPQASIYVGPVGFEAEYVQTRQQVNKAGDQAELVHDAWQLTLHVVLTGERATYESLLVASPASLSAGTWGALELCLRVDHAQYSHEALGRFADPKKNYEAALAYWAGINWFSNDNVKLTANFVYTKLEGDASLPASEKAVLGQAQIQL